MGYLTRDEFISEVRENLGGRTDITDATIIRKLNLALQKISRKHDFRDLQRYAYNEIGEGEVYIKTAEEVREVYSFILVDNSGIRRKLVRVAIRAWDKMFENSQRTSTAVPTHYNVWRQDLQLYPVPNDSYKVELKYTVWPDLFEAGVDNNKVAQYEHLDDVIINFATSEMFRQLNQNVEADNYLSMAMIELRDAIKEDKIKPDEFIVPNADIESGGIGEYWNDPFINRGC
jgi:hypothetical protein